jgi:predicted O-methyltransferase YrrM
VADLFNSTACFRKCRIWISHAIIWRIQPFVVNAFTGSARTALEGDLNLTKSIKTWLKDHLPQSFVGIVEYHLEPERLDTWGGPFNGQCFRQLIFIDLVRACRFEAIVETGTFRGSTTLFLSHNSNGAPVHSSEISPRFFQVARRRLRSLTNLQLYNLDSRAFLSALYLPSEARTFFYLDAHWRADLPLADETEFVIRKFGTFVIMIDDFEVPGDSGYNFDDYGPGKRLSLRDFPFHKDNRICVYFPSRPASQESGIRRGCIVLVSPNLKEAADSLECLLPIARGS